VSATHELVSFVCRLAPEELSEQVLGHACHIVLDLLGAAVAGARTPMAQAGLRFAHSQFRPGPASVIGSPDPLSPSGASWSNGIAASALDIDEGHRLAMGHPAATVVPAGLAIAESVKASGADFLAAVVAGYEVSVRASVARVPTYKDRQYSSGIWGVLGAAAAAGKLLGLDEDGLQSALGTAASHGPFPPAGPDANYSMAKEVIGWAGMTGCSAALLAEGGFTGPRNVLDYSGRWNTSDLIEGLGNEAPLAILSAYFKPYAVCRWAHAPIDATIRLAKEHDLQPHEVERVIVETFYEGTRLLDYAPETVVAAQFSIPFALALALSYRQLNPAQVSERNLRDPGLLQLARKVEVTVDQELNRLYPTQTAARVTIETSRGRFQDRVDSPRGSPDNPLTEDELLAKFHVLAAPVVGDHGADRIRDAVLGLPALQDITALTGLLRF
jgi:2-methylcitrate dehydratase PrpD